MRLLLLYHISFIQMDLIVLRAPLRMHIIVILHLRMQLKQFRLKTTPVILPVSMVSVTIGGNLCAVRRLIQYLVCSSHREGAKMGTALHFHLTFSFCSSHYREECRFPHILPDGATAPNQSTFRQSKTQNGPSRPPRGPHVNGHGNLAEKLNNLNLRDDQRLKNNTERSNRPNEGTLHKLKSQPNGKHHNLSGFNGHHNHIKKGQHTRQHPQRVPSADEFPVLAGSITPPKIVNGNGHIGLTAAQVLQAPPPMRKDVSKDSSTRNTTPEPARGMPSSVCDLLSILKSLKVTNHSI